MAKSNVVIEVADDDLDEVVTVEDVDTDAVDTDAEDDADDDGTEEVETAKEQVLVVTALSSSGIRSTRNAGAKFKKALPEGGTLWAVEISRAAIPAWRIQNYWLSESDAQVAAELSVGPNKTGGAVLKAQVVEAAAVLVEVH